ncbi:hypothetical protein ARMSODRAFT_978889 [Armillaria solidipes]|uniref:Heterokaryon incompatibility domain-containing protein n=1 Tax=Armillaria solidipes TaxID=1076256 RepID=A0A2H3BNK5_9AGAR|nr:hypothetical protein ARMSODRAFT_978889 [Armillaria solidipes]
MVLTRPPSLNRCRFQSKGFTLVENPLYHPPCATLGIEGVLIRLNATLGTSHTLDTPSLSSLLNDCIERNDDFGTAYGRLRPVWYTKSWSTIRDELHRREKEDKERRQKALVGNRIIDPSVSPRHVWDLYSNRVLPSWSCTFRDSGRAWGLSPISHAWADEKDHVDVWTPINGKEWPVPIPKDANLNLIRIEMLNLGIEYTWLDVLCLRQKGGLKEDLHVEEWKLDVPTIGEAYHHVTHAKLTVIYLGRLGRPFSLKAEDLYSGRSWLRRAWTLPETRSISGHRIFAGDTSYGPLHVESEDEDKASTYQKKLELLKAASHNIENVEYSEMKRRTDAEHYFPYVTISALTEINRKEPLSIDIPLQREYAGRKPVIWSSLADTRYEGVDELFHQLNTTLGTSYKLTNSLT